MPLLSALPPRVTSCYSVKLPLGETSQCLATLLRLSIVTCVCHLRINCNCPNCKVYLFKLQSVFVQITKCICPTSHSVLGNSFAALYCYHWLPARVTQRVSGCERGEKQTKRWNTGWNFSTALSGWYNLFVVKFWADMFEQYWYWSSQTSG